MRNAGIRDENRGSDKDRANSAVDGVDHELCAPLPILMTLLYSAFCTFTGPIILSISFTTVPLPMISFFFFFETMIS